MVKMKSLKSLLQNTFKNPFVSRTWLWCFLIDCKDLEEDFFVGSMIFLTISSDSHSKFCEKNLSKWVKLSLIKCLTPIVHKEGLNLSYPYLTISKSIFVPNLLCPWKDGVSSKDTMQSRPLWNHNCMKFYTNSTS